MFKRKQQKQAKNRAVTYETSTWLEDGKQQVFTEHIYVFFMTFSYVAFLGGTYFRELFS